MERRFCPQSDGRSITVTTRSSGVAVVAGYASVFYDPSITGSEYELWDTCVERIRKGAFDRALREQHNVACLLNHSPDNLLGRTSSGTCRLSVDRRGLRYECDIDESDADHLRVLAKITRGDLTGSSFAFKPTAISWESRGDGSDIRWIDDLTLFDVGPVTYPAYEATTTGLRSDDGLDQIREDHRRWLLGEDAMRDRKMREIDQMMEHARRTEALAKLQAYAKEQN